MYVCMYIQNTHRFRGFKLTLAVWLKLRHGINRLTKRGNEKSPSDGHYQCKKEMYDHLIACQPIFEKVPHSSDTPCLALKERASFFGTPDWRHSCSIAQAGILILWVKIQLDRTIDV
jgi:hypothetical protein